MIQVHTDDLGNVTGYWDTLQGQWTTQETYEAYIASQREEVTDEAPAADADDDGEPVAEVDMEGEEPTTDFTSLTKDELKAYLDGNGIPYNKSATKDQLLAIIQAEV